MKEYIIDCSSLCVFDEHSFIYAYKGTFLQISKEDGSVLCHWKGGKFNGYLGIISLKEESTLLLRMVKGYQSLNFVVIKVEML